MMQIISIYISLFLLSNANGNDETVIPSPDQINAYYTYPGKTRTVSKVDHSIWEGLLSRHVNSKGNVDYESLKQKENVLDKYLKGLSGIHTSDLGSGAEKMAFWINAYNAFTIKLVLKHYPLKSIMDIENGKAWDLKWIQIDGKKYSLNEIEHEVIRPQFQDARIHFAVNCAARSCPPIWNHAWTAANLEEQLESSTKSFINNQQFNTIGKNKLVLSSIFKWYAEDFNDVVGFIQKYATIKTNKKVQLEYLEYDWNLNSQ